MERPIVCGVLERPGECIPDRAPYIQGKPESRGRPPADQARAIAMLFTGQYDHLLRLARFFGAGEEAEDLVAEAFCELHRHWTSLRSSEGALGYLRATVGNLTRMHIRRRQVVRRRMQTLAPAPEPARSAEQTALANHGRRAVVDALALLPHRQREAIVLRFWMALTDSEIADAMGISSGAVKVHIFRGMAGLRRMMIGEGR